MSRFQGMNFPTISDKLLQTEVRKLGVDLLAKINTLFDEKTDQIIATADYIQTIVQGDKLIDKNYAIQSGKWGLSLSPLSIKSGVTVTIPSGSTWRII